MANESTTTTLNDLLPSIVAEAMFQAQEKSIMRGLVKNYTMPLNSGKTLTVPVYPAVSAAAVAEGTDLTNTAISTGGATLTVSEVGVMSTVTDLALRTSSSNVIADVGSLFGSAIAKKIDTDLMALFDGLGDGSDGVTTPTGITALGDGTTQISAASIFEAVAKLRGNGVPATDLACVLHPYVAYDLKAGMTNTFASASGNAFASDIANEALRTGYIGTLAGVPIFESSNIADTSGDSKGAVFHRDALGLAMMQDIQIEQQRDASLRSTELVATSVYAVGEIFDGYGVELNFDSSIV